MNNEKFFLKTPAEKKDILNSERKYYSDWRNENEQSNKPFFAVHSDFEVTCLKEISGGALKLYVYLGFRAKYRTGEVWESIPEISNFFEKDERTVAKWFSELERANLVSRYQTGFNRAANSFLKPYGFRINIINSLGYASFKSVQEYITQNDLRHISRTVLLNYDFIEYSVVLEQRINETEYIYHCFINYDHNEIVLLQNMLNLDGIFVDNFDINQTLMNPVNQYRLIYSELLKYHREEIL